MPVSEDGQFAEKILGVQDLRRTAVRAAFQQAGIDLTEVGQFFRLRAELAEIFTRYGEIGEDGLFHQLDGVLRHRLPEVDDAAVAHADLHPPADTRAKYRGHLVRELGGSEAGKRMMVNWSRVTDCTRNRRLDLPDPFIADAKWIDLPDPERPRRRIVADLFNPPDALTRIVAEQLNEVRELYDRGRMDEAAMVLDTIRSMIGRLPGVGAIGDFHLWDARVHARLASGDALERLERHYGDAQVDFSQVVDRVCILRFTGLTPPARIESQIMVGKALAALQPELGAGDQSFLDHAGYTQLRRGQFAEALATLERAVALAPREARIEARTHADLADALRAIGRHDEAASHLQAAEQLQLNHRLLGEHAEMTCIVRGRLAACAGARREAIVWLKRASGMLTPERAPAPFVRVHLLRARLPGGAALGATRRAVEEVRAARPALAACPLLAQVLEHWVAWTTGEPSPGGHPDKMFWGV
ncbi:MAG: proteasome accessory factor PafA2 family protein [Chthoniobacteraceae bacterium]